MKFHLTLAAITACLAAGSATAEIRMEVLPAQPKQNEPVHVRVTSQAGDGLVRAGFEFTRSQLLATPNNRFSIIPAGYTGAGGDEPVDHTFYLGRLPAGSYSVNLGTGSATLKSIAFTVESSSRARTFGGAIEAESPDDHSGLWYNPNQTGSSVVLFQSPATRELGGGIYGYAADKSPTWYTVSPGTWLNSSLTIYQADLYRSVGSPIGGPYSAADFTATKVGTAKLTFTGINQLSVEMTINGVTTVNTYSRFAF